jgi:hypothetical protein
MDLCLHGYLDLAMCGFPDYGSGILKPNGAIRVGKRRRPNEEFDRRFRAGKYHE